MTVGENIRRIRQERGLTLKQLGDMLGVSEAYIRAYESGRRNPKIKSLEALAQALSVNVEVLTNSDFDGVKAMHRLFQVFRQYDEVKKRGEALLKAEADFNLWMDIYPESEPWTDRLKIQKMHDQFMDNVGLNQLQ
jgi:transcriptional regulator with XRE-family HTH domain